MELLYTSNNSRRIYKNNDNNTIIKIFEIKDALLEMSFLRYIDCPYIIKPISLEIKRNNEYIEGIINLPLYNNYHKSMKNDCNSSLFWLHILKALHYLEVNEILHNDIKLDNIVFDSIHDRYIIIDFGNAQLYSNRHHSIGTYYSSSPELLLLHLTREQKRIYEDIIPCLSLSHKSDMWSYGCLLYEFYTSIPFYNYDDNVDTILSSFGNNELLEQKLSLLQEPYRSIVKECLSLDPKQRPSASSLLMLYHQELPNYDVITTYNDNHLEDFPHKSSLLEWLDEWTLYNHHDLVSQSIKLWVTYMQNKNPLGSPYSLKMSIASCFYIVSCLYFSVPSLAIFCNNYIPDESSIIFSELIEDIINTVDYKLFF
jgi:serine/threonine protein kinase